MTDPVRTQGMPDGAVPRRPPRLPEASVGPADPRAAARLRRLHFGLPGESAAAAGVPLLPAVVAYGTALAARGAALDDAAAVVVLAECARRHAAAARAAFRADLERRVRVLRDRLALDAALRAEARSAPRLGAALGPLAARLIDAGRLAVELGSSSVSASVDDVERRRVEAAVDALERYAARRGDDADGAPVRVVVVHPPSLAGRLAGCAEHGLTPVPSDDPVATAIGRFDEEAGAMTEVLRAVRVARLEEAAAYDPARHEAWLDRFAWRGFTAAELALLDPIVAVVDERAAGGSALPSLSSALASGRPVQVLVVVDPLAAVADLGADDVVLAGHRPDLVALGMAHPEAFVLQSSVAAPAHLAAGCARAVASGRAALHVVDGGWRGAAAADREAARLAVESRALPLVVRDPDAGDALDAPRLSLVGNPAPEADWSREQVEVERGDGTRATLEVAVTYADAVLADPRCAPRWPVADPADGADALVPLASWLELPREEAGRRVPFVWAVADAPEDRATLARCVVPWAVATACRARRDAWRALAERAGLRDDRVAAAVAREREHAVAHEAELAARLAAEHAAALEEARRAAVRATAARIAHGLVGGQAFRGERQADVLGVPQVGTLAGAGPSTPAPASVPVAPSGGDAPWIESALCTSCNECVNLNGRMFAYDAEKRAYLRDARAGTYRQLVTAAERCPARVIHPGQPLDPSEPGLDALRARAAPFG